MSTTALPVHQKVSDYINALPEWSKNSCLTLRSIILQAHPSLVEEWKWGPHYSSHGMVCGYGAFQKHIKFTFFNGAAMKDAKGIFNHCTDNEFSRSIKYNNEAEIDADTLTAYIRESVAINEKGYKRIIKDKTIMVPEDLQLSLSTHKKAQAFFDDLSYGYKKEYVEWVTAAKRPETRSSRIEKVVANCGEGRKLNDKYK